MFKLPDDLYFVISPDMFAEIGGVSKDDAIERMIRHGEDNEPFRILRILLDVETNMPEATDDITEDMIQELMDSYGPSDDIPTWLIDLNTEHFWVIKNEEAA